MSADNNIISAIGGLPVIGAAVSVLDSDALSDLPVEGLTVGTKAFNRDVGHNFSLTVSTASLDPDVVLSVRNYSGLRWILDTSDSEVQSVTGDVVTNTDPRNPVISSATILSALPNATTSVAGLQSAADKTMQAGQRGFAASAVLVAAQDISITGLTGDSDGGYIIEGTIVTPGAAPREYTLRLNGAEAVEANSCGSITSGTTVSTAVSGQPVTANLYIGSVGEANPGKISFRCVIGSKQGIIQHYSCTSFFQRDGGGGTRLSYAMSGQFTMDAEIVSVGIHGSAASSVGIGSTLKLSKMGFTV